MKLGERVKQRRKDLKMSRPELCSKANLSLSSLAKLEDRPQATSKFAPSIAKALEVRLKWLLEGIEPMSPNEAETATPRSNAEIIGGLEEWGEDTPLRDDEVIVPFYTEVALSAGSGSLVSEDGIMRNLRFSRETLKRRDVISENVVCVRVKGDSMEPVLNNGDTVGINTACTTIKDGKTYAIRHGDEVRIKTLYNTPLKGIRVVSFNAAEYPAENYTAEEIEKQGISIIGKIFWSSTLWD